MSYPQSTGGCCPYCHLDYAHFPGVHGEGFCIPMRPNPVPVILWKEADVRRIVREELERAKEKP